MFTVFCVNLHVRFEVGALVEASIADGTFVRRLLQVRHLVNGERPRLTESFATIVALERLLFGVNVAVIAQMVLPAKSFAADVAGVGTLVGVRPLVYQQIVGLGELTIAVFANKLLLWTCSSRASDF